MATCVNWQPRPAELRAPHPLRRRLINASDAALLATPWPATKAAIEGLGDLAGKLLIDATNPLLPNLAGLEYGTTTSGAEQVAGWASGAKVVKPFKHGGFQHHYESGVRPGPARHVLLGDDAAAKQTVRPLIEQLGFEAVDAGPLSQARLLEPFALLWISLALVHGQGREIGFKLLRR